MTGIPQHIIDAADDADESLIDLQSSAELPETDSFGDAEAGDDEGHDLDSGADLSGSDDDLPDLDLPEFHADGSGDTDFGGELGGGDGDVDWKQRALVAEGRNKVLGPQFAQLQREVAELRQGGDVSSQIEAYMKQQRAEEAEQQRMAQVRSKMADEFGDDHLELMDDFIAASLPKSSVAPVKSDVAGANVGSAMDYEQTVYAAHPNFDQINNDPKFHQFLQGVGGDGVSHGQRINAAHQARQAGAVIGLVNQFLFNANSQGQQNLQRKQALQRQVAPSRSRGGAHQQSSKQQYLTPDQIASYYDKFNKGQFNGRPQQWEKVQRVIDASERHYLQG